MLPSVDDLPKARKNQCAAFLATELLLVVWDDDPTKVVERATAIENELMELVWKAGEAADVKGPDPEKTAVVNENEVDVEANRAAASEERPTNIFNSLQVALTIMLIITMLSFGYKELAFQLLVDKGWWRLAFLVLTPVLIFFSLVSLSRFVLQDLANKASVLLTSHCHEHPPMRGAHPPNAVELQVLLCHPPTTHHWRASAHHRAVPRLQGGSHFRHRTHGQIAQGSHHYL